jgi:hypothetical protein
MSGLKLIVYAVLSLYVRVGRRIRNASFLLCSKLDAKLARPPSFPSLVLPLLPYCCLSVCLSVCHKQSQSLVSPLVSPVIGATASNTNCSCMMLTKPVCYLRSQGLASPLLSPVIGPTSTSPKSIAAERLVEVYSSKARSKAGVQQGVAQGVTQ